MRGVSATASAIDPKDPATPPHEDPQDRGAAASPGGEGESRIGAWARMLREAPDDRGAGVKASLDRAGSYIYYWSSEPHDYAEAWSLFSAPDDICGGNYTGLRYYGNSVRPVQDFAE